MFIFIKKEVTRLSSRYQASMKRCHGPTARAVAELPSPRATVGAMGAVSVTRWVASLLLVPDSGLHLTSQRDHPLAVWEVSLGQAGGAGLSQPLGPGGDFVQVAEAFPAGAQPLGELGGGRRRSAELSAGPRAVRPVLGERWVGPWSALPRDPTRPLRMDAGPTSFPAPSRVSPVSAKAQQHPSPGLTCCRRCCPGVQRRSLHTNRGPRAVSALYLL